MAERAGAQGLDVFVTHMVLYQLAFMRADTAVMQREVAWAAAGGQDAVFMLSLDASAKYGAGRIAKARDVATQAANSAQRQGLKESAAGMRALAAECESVLGNLQEAHRKATEALTLSRDQFVDTLSALALAQTGDSKQAMTLTDDLVREHPLNTLLNSVYVPAVRAVLEIQRNNPAQAITLLETARPYELGFGLGAVSYLAIYVRGEAYLHANQGDRAAGEYQKILNHRGIDPTSLFYPLAHLGLGRAYALEGDKLKARTAYQDFFTLWKGADADIPVLNEAKAEYAKLR